MTNWDALDPTGCTHADAHFAEGVIDKLGLCGCGDPEAIIAEVSAVLRVVAEPARYVRRDWQPPSAEWGALGAELLLHVMNNANLLEHGTSVGGSWITDEGRRFLDIASRLTYDEMNESGSMCSQCPETAKIAPVQRSR